MLKQDVVPFLQAHFLASVGVPYSLFSSFFFNETTNQLFLEVTGFWSNAERGTHLIFRGIKLINGQATVLSVK